jgi:hypothetical protein
MVSEIARSGPRSVGWIGSFYQKNLAGSYLNLIDRETMSRIVFAHHSVNRSSIASSALGQMSLEAMLEDQMGFIVRTLN